MKNLFLLILFFGVFFGAQFVYFENRLSDQKEINFDDVSASIVTIESINNRGKSFGSGVIISDDGYIITAFHVLSGNLSTVKISGKSYLANLIGFDEYADLAVLKINEQDLKHIEFSDEAELEIGQTVYAIGNPYNLGTSVSRGILSATGRNFGNPYLDIIQTDAAINKGNSGGALINNEGELIGLSTLIASASGGSDGVGFALPSDKVLSITNEIIKYGKVNRAWLGDFTFRKGFFTLIDGTTRIPALYVVELNNSSEFTDGLQDGDIIIGIKGTEARWNVLLASVNSISPGEVLELKVIRSDEQLDLNLVTKERPNTPRAL
jgi:S1-C subfamily serine protease